MTLKIDKKSYMKRMRELWQDGVRDYFSRYGLDIECEDEARIRENLTEIPRIWSENKQNPYYAGFLPRFQEEHRKASETLLDERLRAAHRKEHAGRRAAKEEDVLKRLAERVNLLQSQGVAFPDQIDGIHREFGPHLPPQTIEAALAGIPVDDWKAPPTLGRSEAESIDQYLGLVEAKNLYDFLEVDRQESPERIEARRQERLAAAGRQARERADSDAITKLCMQVKTVLLDPRKRTLYDNTLDGRERERLAGEVRFAARSGMIPVPTARRLLQRGLDLELEEAAARAVIIRTAVDLGVSVGFEDRGRPRCPVCNLGIQGSPERCPACKSPLTVVCPRCRRSCPTRDSACDCGLATADMPRLAEIAATWRHRCDLELHDEVKSDLAWAAGKIGRDGWVADALAEIARVEREQSDLVDRCNRAEREGRFHAAREALQELAARFPRARVGGRPAGDALARVEARLEGEARCLERARDLERQRRLDEAAAQYQEALQLAGDCREAQEGLQRCPPAPPRGPVAVRQRPGAIVLSWPASPSQGAIRYLVLRKPASPSTSAVDGERVHETGGRTFEDTGFVAGRPCVYTVFASRAGVVSAGGASSPLVLPTAEVREFRLEPGDGVVQGTWVLPGPAVAEVRVVRKRGSEPRDASDGEEVRLGDRDRFVCRDLQNAQRWFFRVCCGYRAADGRLAWTPGVVAQAVPAAPPPPVGDLDLARGDDGSLRLTWRDPGRGEVEILRCGKRPEQAPGTTRPRAELFALGQPVRRIAPATCEDRDPPAGLVFYAAVTRDGDLATLGAVLRATNLPEVADLEARFLGRSIRCTWTWPPDCPRCAVAWRHDRYPLAHDEAEAWMQILSAGQYQRRGCFEIPVADGVRRDHYVSVFAGAAGTHEDLFSGAASPGARRLLPLGRGGRVAYSLTPVRKRWPPGALDGYRLTVGAETRLAAPELVLVRFRGKRAPTSPAGGDVVLRIEPRTLGPGRDHVVSLKPAVLGRRPFVLRLFLADDRDYARFEIRHPSPGTLAFT